MLNKHQETKKLLKISSEKFIDNLEKRGNNYDEKLKNDLYNLENEYKSNNIKRHELYEKYNISSNISNLIEIFQILDKYNINYINYVLIYDNLDIQQLKNFYRYIMIKWNKVQNNLRELYKGEDIFFKIDNFKFQDKMQKINVSDNIEEVKNLILQKIKDFIFINNNKFPNIYIIFFVNTLQEYLYPI